MQRCFMAYVYRPIFDKIEAMLSAAPWVSLGDLTRQIRVSRHTLEAVVRQAAGKGFREYKKELLLKRALDLLVCQGELSQKQIAAMLGYGSGRAFARFVKGATERSPGDIRRRETSLVRGMSRGM